MDTASVRLIGDIRGSADKFLWVGASAAPTGAPAPPPNGCGETTTGTPDSDGDCRCNRNLFCFLGDRRGCPFSGNGNSAIFHSATCSDCECRRRRRAGSLQGSVCSCTTKGWDISVQIPIGT